MSFEFFHERLPWQPKLSCNAYKKNFIYVFSTLSSIILSKINDLAQRVHVSEFYIIFHIYPSHLRSVNVPCGPILAILYREVPHMLNAKYKPNWPNASGEEVV